MKSAIYIGSVRHRRFHPKPHDFTYWMVYFFVDLSEIDTIFRYPLFLSQNRVSLLAFRRKNYLGRADQSIDSAVRETVREKFGRKPAGPIRMLSQMSYFGFCFNPVTFYYCYDLSGTNLEFIVADVTNTPWNERHAYAVECISGQPLEFTVPKDFHVSPFMPMEMVYKWNFVKPGEQLNVHMENKDLRTGVKVFDATMTLRRRRLNFASLVAVLAKFPLMTVKAALAIYYEAVILKIKGLKYHPKKINAAKNN